MRIWEGVLGAGERAELNLENCASAVAGGWCGVERRGSRWGDLREGPAVQGSPGPV